MASKQVRWVEGIFWISLAESRHLTDRSRQTRANSSAAESLEFPAHWQLINKTFNALTQTRKAIN